MVGFKPFMKPLDRQRIKWDMETAILLANVIELEAGGDEAGYIFDCLQRVREMKEHGKVPANLNSQVESRIRVDPNWSRGEKTILAYITQLEAPTPQATDAAECAQKVRAMYVHHGLGVSDKDIATIIQAYADSQVATAQEEVKRLREALRKAEQLISSCVLESNMGEDASYVLAHLRDYKPQWAALNPTESVG